MCLPIVCHIDSRLSLDLYFYRVNNGNHVYNLRPELKNERMVYEIGKRRTDIRVLCSRKF